MKATPCRDERAMPLFYSDDPSQQRQAAAMCAGCPLLDECRRLGATEEWGVWGGVTQWERSPQGESKRGPKTIDPVTREERNRQIVELRRGGSSNAAIAKTYGLHPNMVSRIFVAARLGVDFRPRKSMASNSAEQNSVGA